MEIISKFPKLKRAFLETGRLPPQFGKGLMEVLTASSLQKATELNQEKKTNPKNKEKTTPKYYAVLNRKTW